MHPNFIHQSTTHLDGLAIDVQVYQHQDTGLMHYHLACDNDENALMIGFATQPMTSRGEAHILEHVVLCGSQKYPVRDPFFSMIKRSLQTFMNAMTASDWTVYPFATQNKKDYFNLLSVYLDAVLFPNIHELDFAQEGIRIELNDENKPEFHGIVFNEMKGAMSGEIDQLYYALVPHLFDTTTYHYNSGGDPAHIPKLTHQDLVEFHKKYYHPSNAIVMSFGNIDVGDIQSELQTALGRFDDKERPKRSTRFFVNHEIRHTAPIKIHDTYTADSDDKEMTHQVMAWLLPAITDPKMSLAMRMMEGVLIEHSGLPLRKYLETTELGQAPSPLLGLDDSHHEMVFYAGLRGSEKEHTDAFERELLALLNDVASHPIDNETIETILHQIELDKRHIGGDSMPYGLTLMLEALSTAIHGGNPIDVWQIDEHLTWLKTQLTDPMWLPNLIKTHLIDNPHRVLLTLSPDSQKANQLIKNEQLALDELDKQLTDADRTAIRQKTQALAERQATPDDVELLPKVDLDDIPNSVSFVDCTPTTIDINGQACPLYQYNAGTNGLYYYQLAIKLDESLATHPLMPLYLTLLSELGTDKYDARDFQAHQARHGSGVTARISQRTSTTDKDQMSTYFVLATRALAGKHEATDVLREVLTDTVFDEIDRMSELLKQRQMSWQSRLAGSGHAYAMQTANRYTNKLSALEYSYSGLPALKALKAFLERADNNEHAWQMLALALSDLHRHIIALPNKLVILVCEPNVRDTLTHAISHSLTNLPSNAPKETPKNPQEFDELHDLFATLQQTESNNQQDIAWLISTNVYHNAKAYPAVPSAHPDAPALTVLAVYLRHGYLHSAIREKGGAYGGGASFDGNTASFKFYSYRDPHLEESFTHFDKAVDWLLTEKQEPHQLEEAILGIMAGMDKPASPAGEAVKSCFADLHGRGREYQNAQRQKILAVTLDDLKRVARTYLKDKPCVQASIAPLDKETQLTNLGFECQRLG